MIKAAVTPDMLKRISAIEECRFRVSNVKLPALAMNRLRKNSKKKSSYASNKIEGNPLIVAAVTHYQLVTIHPFEDGNGRTARLVSGYILDRSGYGFQGIGSLEEYFAYDPDEYYASLQMGLPALYYDGRENPPHPEIWIDYFLRMVELYAGKATSLASGAVEADVGAGLARLGAKEKGLLAHLLEHGVREYTPIDVSRALGVTNRTVINWTAALVENGFVEPVISGQRVRSYVLTGYSLANGDEILALLGR